MCSTCISEQVANLSLYSIHRLDSITEMLSVYSAVRTEYLYNTYTFPLYNVNSVYGVCASFAANQADSVTRCLSEYGITQHYVFL